MLSLTSPVRTWLHDVPPGGKLLAMLAFATALFPVERIDALIATAIIVALLYLSCGTRLATAGLRALRPLLPFLAIIAVWHLATGTPQAGIGISLKLLAAVGLANLVTMTTRLEEIMDAVAWPARRLGLNPRIIGMMIAMVVRFTPALGRKGTQLIEAWRARSARQPGMAVVPPLLLAALDDADHVAEALRARGGVASIEGS